MNKKLFSELEIQAFQALRQKNVKKALSTIQSMLYLLPDGRLEDKCIALREAYEGLLNCLKRGIHDDNREQSFLNMWENAWQIALDVKRKFVMTQTEDFYAQTYATVHEELPFSSYQLGLEFFAQQVAAESDAPHFRQHELNYVMLFNHIWTYGRFSENDYQEICQLVDSQQVFLNDQLLIVSALFLSHLQFPDHRKIQLLIHCLQSEVLQIQVRAFVSLTILSLQDTTETIFSADFQPFYDWLQDAKHQDHLVQLTSHLLDTRHAQEFIEKVETKLSPEIKKLIAMWNEVEQRKDEPNADLKAETYYEQLKEKTEKLRKLESSGKDLNLSTFGRHKNIRFFLFLANWFYPFTWHHSQSYPILEKDDKGLMQLFFASYNLCDSDRWSALPLLQQIGPPTMQVPPEIRAYIPPQTTDWNTLCMNYVHDLYRFYKMFVFRSNFVDIFKDNLNPLYQQHLWQTLDKTHQEQLASVLYNQRLYADVISILRKYSPQSPTPCKQLAHSFQQMGQYSEAIHWYNCCDLSDTDKWTRKQLVTCYGHTGAIERALDTLAELCEIDSKHETSYNRQRAEYLIDQKEYQQALNLLHKIAFFDENDQQAIRAIAWCYLQTNRPQKAKQYWRKIQDLQAEDWLNGGHIYWALNDEQNAHTCYWKYLQQMKDAEEAEKIFLKDLYILQKYGKSPIDITLMLQALQR